MEENAAGGIAPRIVDLRITPLHAGSGDVPFDAGIEVIDPASNMVLATKNRSTFFPRNWTWAQVEQAIYEAMTHYVETTGNPPLGIGLHSSTDAGVRMTLHVSGNALQLIQVYSAYPRGPQLWVTAAHAPV
jgi:hypothetical protein